MSVLTTYQDRARREDLARRRGVKKMAFHGKSKKKKKVLKKKKGLY